MLLLNLLACVGCSYRQPVDADYTRQICGLEGDQPISSRIYNPTWECEAQIWDDFHVIEYSMDHPGHFSLTQGAMALLDQDWPVEYERIAGAFESTHFVTNEGPISGVVGRKLMVRGSLGASVESASVLYHESIHAIDGASSAHIDCPAGELACDDFALGAYGMQAWLLETGSDRALPEVAAEMRELAWYIRESRIILGD